MAKDLTSEQLIDLAIKNGTALPIELSPEDARVLQKVNNIKDFGELYKTLEDFEAFLKS